jgi:hypothetical protein
MPPLDLDLGEARVGGRDPHVGGEQQLYPDRHAPSLHGDDEWGRSGGHRRS